MHIFCLPSRFSSSFHYPSSCRLAGFRSLQTAQLNASSFICNLLSPSAVSPLQLTTSAHPLPAPTFRLLPSSGLSTPVSRRFIFLPLSFRFLSSASRSLPVTQLPVLPFSPPSVPPPSGFPNALSFAFAPNRSSPSTQSGFPSCPSGSAYSACCLFPFILPCFAPTAAPQVLTSAPLRFLWFPSVCSLAARFLSSASGLEPDYSASVSSFPFFIHSPHSGSCTVTSVSSSRFQLALSVSVFRFRLSSLSPACFHAFLPDLVLSFAAFPFNVTVSPHSGLPPCLSFVPLHFLRFPLGTSP